MAAAASLPPPASHKVVSYGLPYLDRCGKGVLGNVVQPRETDAFQRHQAIETVSGHGLGRMISFPNQLHPSESVEDRKAKWLRYGFWSPNRSELKS